MKKQSVRLTLFLIVLSVLLLCGAASAEEALSGSCGEALVWTLASDGTLTISGTGPMADYSSSSPAPWHEHRESIGALVIGEGVESIGRSAFNGCTGVREAVLSEGLVSIGADAFCSCTSLEAISLPDSVISIGAGAFSACEALVSADIPAGVTTIEPALFVN